MFEIWSDNALEADWFQSLDSRFLGAKIHEIKGRGKNPAIIESLVAYDRPDIILLKSGEPVLVVEKTREVPTGHNVGQRFARLARAAEHGVPSLFFLPFDARKHGKHSSICSLNTRLIRALLKMGALHEIDVLPVNWPADKSGELVISGSENSEMKLIVAEILDELAGSRSRRNRDAYLVWLKNEQARREKVFPNYRDLPKSAFITSTASFIAGSGFKVTDGSKIPKRINSLIYRIDMSPEKAKRQDPYTGTQFIYDYGWLRNGPNPENREANLILWVPFVSKQVWMELNPEDYNSKSCNWYLIADGIALEDGFIEINKWPTYVN